MFIPNALVRSDGDILPVLACSTKGKSDTISCSQFIDFLNDKQRDPRLNEILYPLYNEKRATEIIDEYEQDKENRARSKINDDQKTIRLLSHVIVMQSIH